MAHEVLPERAPRLRDPAVCRELDEIERLVLVEVAVGDQVELDGGAHDALAEVVGREREPVAEELEHVVVARGVVGLLSWGMDESYPQPRELAPHDPDDGRRSRDLARRCRGDEVLARADGLPRPVAVVVVGATIGIVLFWVKVIRESRRAELAADAAADDVDRCSVRGGTYRGRMVASWKVEPVSFADVRALGAALGVSETVATVLVRRGLGDPDGGARLPRSRGHRARPAPAR